MPKNELCKLKGHMWYSNKRKEIMKEDGLYSITTERKCARCGEIQYTNYKEIENEKV